MDRCQQQQSVVVHTTAQYHQVTMQRYLSVQVYMPAVNHTLERCRSITSVRNARSSCLCRPHRSSSLCQARQWYCPQLQ